ncbi:extracellular solute-binding protein [Candidatus Aerophobetes bacterium]|nr:extracellular solute-binding protein [Candidatus Aerophobetes bacterium]
MGQRNEKFIPVEYRNYTSTYDVLDFPPIWCMPDWVDAGWLVPLNDVVPPRMMNQWFPYMVPSTMKDGKIYFIRHQVEPRVIYYRKDLIGNAGYKEMPKDWTGLVNLAKKLTMDKNGDGNIDQWGYGYSASPTGETVHETFGSFLYVAGGKFWNEDGSPAFNGPEGLAALKFMSDLVNKYKVTPPGVISYREGNLTDLLDSGAVAIGEGDCSLMLRILSSKPYGSKIGVTAPIPRYANMKPGKDFRYFSKGIGYCVNRYSKHVEAAKRLAAWVGGYEANWFEGAVELNTPANKAVYESPYLKSRLPFADILLKTAENGRVETHKNMSLFEDILAKGVISAIHQDRTPEKAMDWMVTEMKRQKVF